MELPHTSDYHLCQQEPLLCHEKPIPVPVGHQSFCLHSLSTTTGRILRECLGSPLKVSHQPTWICRDFLRLRWLHWTLATWKCTNAAIYIDLIASWSICYWTKYSLLLIFGLSCYFRRQIIMESDVSSTDEKDIHQMDSRGLCLFVFVICLNRRGVVVRIIKPWSYTPGLWYTM